MTADNCPLCEAEIDSLSSHLGNCPGSDRIFKDTEKTYAQ